MGMINDAELWLGKKRVGEELRGNIDDTEVYLEPISKIDRNHVLTPGVFYTVSCGDTVWTNCEYLSTVDSGINLRIRR
jgi:hypothetical protein